MKTIGIEDADKLTGNIDTAMGGLYVTKYNAQDNAGNIAEEANRLVIVKDSPPVIVMQGDFQQAGFTGTRYGQGLRQGSEYVDYGATATDVEDGDLTDQVVVGGDVVDANTLGDYTVTYDVTDSFGNKAEQQVRTVTVYEEFVKQELDNAPEEVPDLHSGCFISSIIGN